MKTKTYKIADRFAEVKEIPPTFIAKQLLSTDKAVYLYGEGRKEKKIDRWFPKSVIQETKNTTQKVTVPPSHDMIKGKGPQEKKATFTLSPRAKNRIIKITFPFSKKVVRQIKTLPGRKYHNKGKNEKFWTAPVGLEAIKKLETFGFSLDNKLLDILQDSKIDKSKLSKDLDIPGLGGTLFDFQKKGVAFIEANKGRALIADEMGLGKTVEALAWLQLHPKKRPAVVVCPSSLKLNWAREARQWVSKPKIQILEGTTPEAQLRGDIIILNYAILKDWVDKIKDSNPQVVILDEAHYFKNNSSKRTKAAKKLAKGIPHVLPMTGTPIVNRPQEALNAIQMVDKSIAPDQWTYLQRYCGAKHNGFGWDFSGASNTDELHQKLASTIMIRRKKKDVLKDLPDKMRSHVPIEIDNLTEYNDAEKDFLSHIRKKTEEDIKNEIKQKLDPSLFDKIDINQDKIDALKEEKAQKAEAGGALAKIEILKQVAVHGKMTQSIKWIKDYLNQADKLVLFCTHKFVVSRLMKEFKDIAVKIDGSVPIQAREDAVQKFQNDTSTKLFVGNIQAAGVGVTLTAASAVAFLEYPWTPGELSQAEDRVHRIGQNNAVNIYYLLAEGTIEEKIASMLDQKRKVLDSVLDGEETSADSLFSTLIAQYK
jgi:SNF2 family DNA or RNA helicase